MGSESASDPRHHPAPEDLLEYASGTSAEWLSLMVACHLTFCPRCREEVAMLDDVGGLLLESANPSADDARGAGEAGRADWIDRAVAGARDSLADRTRAGRPLDAPTGLPPELARVVPRPLHAYVAEPDARWRFLAPGIKHVPLEAPDDVQLRLVQFRPGFVIPPHGHAGMEWLLILDGDIGDSHTGERYGRGDVCRSDVDKEHSQDVSATEPCIAVVANLGPLIPRTLLGRVLARVVKI